MNKLSTIALACSISAFGQTIFIHGADVYPVTSAQMKDVSVLVQDGKIVDIGAKLVAPKGAKILEAKGLRVYPGLIDSATELGLAEIASVRETEDTGEIGEFVPQIRALASVNPESEHFRVVRVNGITSVMTFPGSANAQLISGQAAMIHTDGWTWEQMEIKGSAGMLVPFPALAGGRGRGNAASDEEGPVGRGGADNVRRWTFQRTFPCHPATAPSATGRR